MTKDFLIGCNGRGAQDSSLERPVSLKEASIDEQFRLVTETGVFDYFDRIPVRDSWQEYVDAIQKYNLPIETVSWFYRLGADEALMSANLQIAKEIGAKMHNVMIFTAHADGHVVTNQEIVDCYLSMYDEGAAMGVEVTFELHVNMWSEDFRRVTPVALAVQKRGIPFNYTLDYSHVNFKIDNPEEQDISGIREDVEAGRLILDPFETGNLCDEWLELGIVRWLQVRAAAPNGPKNVWSRQEPGIPVAGLPDLPEGAEPVTGRGIMYPFTKPAPAEWHSPWHAYLLEPTREVVRKVLKYHAADPERRLDFVTTEMINLPDYGHNAKFSLIGQNAAIAQFVRDTWEQIDQE
ncbi:MAG: xylose isomerase [Pseudomonadota bacterium]|nr:xylose isomerase [Pseudomonadota bacterium]